MAKESRNRYLLKNTLIFTLGNIGSKLISFFLIPLYTNILSTSQYGIVDLITTITTVAAPVLTLNIAESVMRFGLDKNVDKEKVTQCGSIILVMATLVGTLLIPICSKIEDISNYAVYIYFYVISQSASWLYLCDLRGKELLFHYSIGSVLQTFMIAILNIMFLLVFKMEIRGYLLAYIIANVIVAIYALVVGKGYKSFQLCGVNISKMKQMIRYSVVLIPNTFMWWIINSSDRVMITYILGAASNGIYAISYKLPTLLSTLVGIFTQAWSYSAIREKGAIDEEDYNNKVFKSFSSIVIMMGLLLLLITKPFLRIYVSKDYYEAWKYSPFLILGSVYSNLGTFVASSYTVHKDSFGYLFSGMFGAFFNIALNCLLIPFIGIYGAAIATCTSYIAVFVFRAFHTRKYIRYHILDKSFISGSILLLMSLLLIFMDTIVGVMLQVVLVVIGLFLYRDTWISILTGVCLKIKNKLGGRQDGR